MPTVQFSNSALVLSANIKEMNTKNMCAYLGTLQSQNYLQLFLLDSHGTYNKCIFKLSNSMRFFIAYNNLPRSDLENFFVTIL